jgi:hypothetical protein
MDETNINLSIVSQMLACLSMLKYCIDKCPEKEWNQAHNDYPFSSVVFHTLFDFDYNLCDDENELRNQVIHKKYIGIFCDYRELMEQIPKKEPTKDFINEYYEFCTRKVQTIMDIRLENIVKSNSDITKSMTRIERYINSIRHIQHHAAQLGLRLQFITGKEIEWISRSISNKE